MAGLGSGPKERPTVDPGSGSPPKGVPPFKSTLARRNPSWKRRDAGITTFWKPG